MLSIGEAPSAPAREHQLLGSENIILRSVEPGASRSAAQSEQSVKAYGLTHLDVRRIRLLPNVADVVRLRDVADKMTNGSYKIDGHVLGVTENFFRIIHVDLARGRPLSSLDEDEAAKVCVVGAEVARALFVAEDPLDQFVTVISPSTSPIPYRIVGILRHGDRRRAAKGRSRNVNREIFILLNGRFRYGEHA